MFPHELSSSGPATYELRCDPTLGMRVPLRVFASPDLLDAMRMDRSLEQLLHVSQLPGVTGWAIGMPDMHEGYGFPVGGVAGTIAHDGVISPGGIGFDINCGVRLLASSGSAAQLGPIERLVHELSRSIPTGYGRDGKLSLSANDMDRVLREGCSFVVHQLGLGRTEDLDHTESRGHYSNANADHVSSRAKARGTGQLGTLGGGNHFLEVQVVDEVFDADCARAFGLFVGQLTILIHTGSRGLGHQVCTDYVARMLSVMARYGIAVADRQLACAPLSSPEGQAYFSAMAAAANFAWANRQVLTQRVREVMERLYGPSREADLRLVYDVAHNIAKLEHHGGMELCVHRKGATRAFGPSHPEVPEAYRGFGQPVFIPGSMGTSSFVLAGRDEASHLSLSSACHGAGRCLSRGAAKRKAAGLSLRHQLEAQGIVVRCPSNAELAEEAPFAYKDVDRVVEVIEGAGIAQRVARLRPLGVLKG